MGILGKIQSWFAKPKEEEIRSSGKREVSAETKKKISDGLKAVWETEEYRSKTHGMTGKVHSEETKRKMGETISKVQLGKKRAPYKTNGNKGTKRGSYKPRKLKTKQASSEE